MTDDANDSFEARLRRDLAAIAEHVPAGTLAGEVAPRPRSTRRPALVAAVVVVVVALGGLVSWNSSAENTGEVDVADTSSTVPTTTHGGPMGDRDDEVPPSESGDYRIWLSRSEVPVGGEIAFAMVGPPGGSGVWGPGFAVDRWNGEDWESVAAAAMTTFPGAAALDLSGEPLLVASLGISVGRAGIAAVEGVSTVGLEAGWYRLVRSIGLGEAGEKTVADGVFRVVENGGTDPGPDWPDPDRLRLLPGLNPVEGGLQHVDLGVEPEPNWAFAVPPHVERWDGVEWIGVMTLDAESAGRGLVLPELPAGQYRVVAGPEVDLRFWVADGVPGAVECHTTLDLGEVLGEDASGFDGPRPPTVEMRSSFDSGGFRAEWEGATQTIRYSYPVGSVIDLVGERTVRDGPVMLWYQGGLDGVESTVEAWVELPGCGDLGAVTAGFTVSGGSEQENVSLALRLGRALAGVFHPDWQAEPRTSCPGPDSPRPDTPNAVHDVWMYCRTATDAEPELVPVPTVFGRDDPIEAVVRRGLGDPWNGLESAVPVQLRGAPTTVEREGGRLVIDVDWDFTLTPDLNGVGLPGVDGPILDQIMATACQSDEIEEVTVSFLASFDVPNDCARWEATRPEN